MTRACVRHAVYCCNYRDQNWLKSVTPTGAEGTSPADPSPHLPQIVTYPVCDILV